MLGDPSSSISDSNADDKAKAEITEVGTGSASSSIDGVVPVSTVVRTVQTLSSPPFLPRGAGVSGDVGRPRADGGDGGSCPTRLQLAAISVLRELVSGQGAEYVVKATAAAVASVGSNDVEEPTEAADQSDAGERIGWLD